MPDAGVLRQDYVQGGQTTVGFTPFPGAAEQIEVLSDQLEQELQHYRAEIARLVQPWSDRWAEAQGWGAKIALLQEARDRGMERGAHAWAHDNVSFLQEVGGYMADIGHYVVDQGEQLVDWYSDLPMLEKVFPTYAAGNALAHQASDAIDEAGEEVQKLWAQRQALLDFFKAIHDQSVNAVQIAIETLSKMGGELGQLMKALWDHGAAWVQGLIEVCRQTDALQKVFASVGAIFTAIPMNLWAEGIGTAGGYIIPELLVSALLAILAALTDGGLAPVLAARLLAYGDKIKDIFTRLGRLGPVLTRLYEGIKELGGKITELTRVVWRNIFERHSGSIGTKNILVRQSAYHATPNKKVAESVLKGIDPKYLNPNSRFGEAFYAAETPETALAETAHHGVVTSHGIRFDVDQSKMRTLDLTDPKIAKKWEYHGGPISSSTKSIGDKARLEGFNAIRFNSERSDGSNLAVLDDFNDILKPQMISPTHQ